MPYRIEVGQLVRKIALDMGVASLQAARDNIVGLLHSQGYRSVRQLAMAAGIPQPTLSRFLDGVNESMDMRNTIKIAVCLGVSVSQLLGEEPLHADTRVDQITRIAARLDNDGVRVLLSTAVALISPNNNGLA